MLNGSHLLYTVVISFCIYLISTVIYFLPSDLNKPTVRDTERLLEIFEYSQGIKEY